MEELGFVPPWSEPRDVTARRAQLRETGPVLSSRPPGTARHGFDRARHPGSIGSDFAAITVVHRRMYWTVDPLRLHPAVAEHARLGAALLPETTGPTHVAVARSLAESGLLAGRIEFFDLRQPGDAADTLVRALQFAGEAEDSQLGAAILAHAAFIPGWVGDRDGASDRLAAARTYARRGRAGPLMWAWLDAVDAECATRSGDHAAALALISRAESSLPEEEPRPPEWMDWFTPIRLAAFKGNTQLKAGHARRARETLTLALDQLPAVDTKQRAVILADLAAAELADEDVARTCRWLGEALDQLDVTWYSTAMERIRDVRRLLRPWQDEDCVRELDDRLYGWGATISALRS